MTKQRWLIVIAFTFTSIFTFVCIGVLGFAIWTYTTDANLAENSNNTEAENVTARDPASSVAEQEKQVATSSSVATEPASEQATGPLAEPIEPNPAQSNTNATTLQTLQSTSLPIRDLYDIAVSFGKISADESRVASESDPGYQVGDTLVFNISNVTTNENLKVDATLTYQTAHASWWVDNNLEVNQEDLESSARVFEEQTYPTNRAIFGSEWSPGVDGDSRIHVFVGDVPGVGGYFSSADEFPRSINPFSNEKEIFYLNASNALPGDSYFDGVLAHEFQHMIHWNIDRNENTWINEGLSELAASLNNLYVGSGAYSFANEPDIPVTRWNEQTLPFYGSSFLLMDYFYERFGEGAVSQLVQNQANGIEGLNQVLASYGYTFNQLYADWAVANLVDDRTIADGRFSYQNATTYEPALGYTAYGYPAELQDYVHQYGTDYIRFESNGNKGPLTIEFSGNQTVSVVPTDAHSGQWMLWGNRGDDMHTLTSRSFDLTALNQATLSFWAWYDIEKDYDYAYVTVSTDGGVHWQPLSTSVTTETNPQGNSFGPAFTNKSGQHLDVVEGSPSHWQEQLIDLTPFAGQQIMIGFHMITDDALNYNGIAIDDVSISELDYFEDFEQGDGGWSHSGFARIDNVLPQYFIVQVVTEGSNGTSLLKMPLYPNNYGKLTIDNFGSEVDRATLLVTAAMPFTTEKAFYSYAAKMNE